MPREHAHLRRERHQDVHHRPPDRRRVRPTADGVLEEDVCGERDGVVRDESEVIVGVAGRLESLDAKRTCLEWALDDLEPVPLDEFPVTGDVVRMGVRRQQMRDLESLALDCFVQRLERCAAVDEDGRPARPVGE